MKFLSSIKFFLFKYSWLFVFLLTIPSFSRLIHKGFFPTHDYIYVARIFEMDKSLKDGQFPVRWVPDFRYGEPLFNFYAPLPYYAGSLIHTFNIGFLDTAKVLYALGFVFSFFSMYLLGKELWGKVGGLVSAFVYLYAPYRSVDVFVRGDLSESWVFIFFPLAFLGALKLSKKINGKNMALLSLSLAGLFFTHNVMTMLIAPFFIVWIVYLAWREKKIALLYTTILSAVLGVGVSASFLLPAFFEKSFIQTQHLTDGYFDFRAHFIEIKQLFSTFWGYGASTWGPEDGFSLQLGTIQWLVMGMIVVLGILKWRKIKRDGSIYLFGILFITFLLSLFMQHNRSTSIWLGIPLLQFVQFPWRFMAISVFLAAVISGGLVKLVPKFSYAILVLVVLSLIAVNYNLFRPESYYDDSIDDHYISAETLSIDDRLPKDYLPIWVKKRDSQKITQPKVVSGQAIVSNYVSRSDSAIFDLSVQNDAVLDIPITFFPGWVVKLDNQKIELSDPSDLGLIRFAAPVGEFKVSAHFGDTPLRMVGNLISAISIGISLYLTFISGSKIIISGKRK